MGCGWWNPPTPYKEDCYWYREEQDMNAHIPYCTCKNQFPLKTCENCDDYHSRGRRTQGYKIRSMSDKELAEFMCRNVSNGTVNCAFCVAAEFCRMGHNGWLDWLRQEVNDGKEEKGENQPAK